MKILTILTTLMLLVACVVMAQQRPVAAGHYKARSLLCRRICEINEGNGGDLCKCSLVPF